MNTQCFIFFYRLSACVGVCECVCGVHASEFQSYHQHSKNSCIVQPFDSDFKSYLPIKINMCIWRWGWGWGVAREILNQPLNSLLPSNKWRRGSFVLVFLLLLCVCMSIYFLSVCSCFFFVVCCLLLCVFCSFVVNHLI